MKKETTIHNTINQGRYEITEETEKEKQLYRGLKEKEREFLHLLYYKFNQSEDFSPLELGFKELLEDLNIDGKNSSYMRNLITSVAKLITTFSTENKSFKTFSIFSYLEYNPSMEKVNVKFNEDLIDFLYCDKDIKLIAKWSEYRKNKRTITKAEAVEFKAKHKGNFTIVSHSEFILLKSSYSMELFSKLSQFKTLKKPLKYTMKEFRELLNIPKTYTPSMIKIRILEVAKKQINENTSIEFNYLIEGTGKNQSVVFQVSQKENLLKKPKLKTKFSEKETSEKENCGNLSSDIMEFREVAKKLGKQMSPPKYFEFLARLIPLKSLESMEELCRDFGLLDRD